MWNCALKSFNTNTCNAQLSALVGDQNNMNTLATSITNRFNPNNRDLAMLVMLSGFGDCMIVIPVANHYNALYAFLDANYDLVDQNPGFLENMKGDLKGDIVIPWLRQNGFDQVELVESIHPNYYYNIEKFHNTVETDKVYYGHGSIMETPIYAKLNNPFSDDQRYIPPSTYPCNYKNIKQCAIDRIHGLGWFDMTLCVLEGVGCVAVNYYSCITDNCFPRRKPNYILVQ